MNRVPEPPPPTDRLEEALLESFPASDPPALSRPSQPEKAPSEVAPINPSDKED
ncbi:hypothetical protein ACFPOB_25185 [Bosea eneae]|uniref:Uncharacterized protein n=1 Tax=Bosea eneae TaxID=151454 RepID=A0ABW0J0F8_9HYPH